MTFKAMQPFISQQARSVLLAELGIVQWRARPGRMFPGAGVQAAAEETLVCEESESVAVSADVSASIVVDMVICADTHSEAEVEQLARIIQAVHGLRAGLRIVHCALQAQPPAAHVLLLLDDASFPSPATMLAQPASKRPLWQSLQDAVARLP